eukprot:2734612-Pleurochrysis_carterae.AAC.2
MEKFNEGAKWHLYCEKGGKAPGGSVLIAKLVKHVADFYVQMTVELHTSAHRSSSLAPSSTAARGQSCASSTAVRQGNGASQSRPSRRGRGGAVNYAEFDAGDEQPIDASEPPWLPAFKRAQDAARTAAEVAADQQALHMIRSAYSKRTERLIAMLLAFDSLFACRRVMRVRFDSTSPAVRAPHALNFAQLRAPSAVPSFKSSWKHLSISLHL